MACCFLCILWHGLKIPSALRVVDFKFKAISLFGMMCYLLCTRIFGALRLQVQTSTAGEGYKGPLHCARQVYSKLGVFRGLYRGWLSVVVCRALNFTYFGTYAVISKTVAESMGCDPSQKLPFRAAIIAGPLAGFCYWCSCFPFDVIKNRIQAALKLYRNTKR